MHSTRAGAIENPREFRVGCDIHPVSNVIQSIEVFGERYLARVFTAAERAECAGLAEVERLTARFAAKEAVLKLLRVPADVAVPWPTIEIVSDAVGAPTVTLTGHAAELAAEQGITTIELSLSHDGGMAMAFAVGLCEQWEVAA